VNDLVQTIINAMAEAVNNQQAAITADAGVLRGITLELQLANNGAVIHNVCWVERRSVHRERKGPAA
jgi:hypothetical protein